MRRSFSSRTSKRRKPRWRKSRGWPRSRRVSKAFPRARREVASSPLRAHGEHEDAKRAEGREGSRKAPEARKDDEDQGSAEERRPPRLCSTRGRPQRALLDADAPRERDERERQHDGERAPRAERGGQRQRFQGDGQVV